MNMNSQKAPQKTLEDSNLNVKLKLVALWPHMIFGAVVEVVILLVIWYAWKELGTKEVFQGHFVQSKRIPSKLCYGL
jgi:hypothetical protein